MADYRERLLEIHGKNMYSSYHVERAIDFALRYDMTGIIFHANDIIDKAVKPEKYFPPDLSLLKFNNRDGDTKNYKYYLSNAIERIVSRGLEFYVEEKEIYFPYEILELFPNLRKENGALCATDPFYLEFIDAKLEEFASRFPDVSGIIVSAGTRESMVSLALNKCECERCKNYSMHRWYKDLLSVMYNALKRHGMKLIVREFSYSSDHQYAIIDAAREISDEIIIAIKKAPHDYYPVFPLNPASDYARTSVQWIEFDAWGQYFGLGVMPASVVEDIQRRMEYYKGNGASGVMIRTDWERLLNGSTFNSFSMLNLIGCAMLSKDTSLDISQVYKAWLEYGLLSPLEKDDTFPHVPSIPKMPDALEPLTRFMRDSYLVQEKAIYVRGHVFNRNAQMFDRYSLTYFIMTKQHTRDYWDEGASRLVDPSKENIEIMIKEKDEAVGIAKGMREYLDPHMLGVSEEIERYLYFLLDAYPLYAEIFKAQIVTAAYIRRVEVFNDTSYLKKAYDSLAVFDSLQSRLSDLIDGKLYTNNIEYVLDSKRIKRFKEDCIRTLKELGDKNEQRLQ